MADNTVLKIGATLIPAVGLIKGMSTRAPYHFFLNLTSSRLRANLRGSRGRVSYG